MSTQYRQPGVSYRSFLTYRGLLAYTGIVPDVNVIFGPIPPNGTDEVIIPVYDLDYGSAKRGFDSLNCKMTEDNYAANVQYLKAWLPVRVEIAPEQPDAGKILYDGLLFDPAPLETGEFNIKAQGAKAFWEDTFKNVIYMIMPKPDDWAEKDADPYNFSDNDAPYTIKTDNALRFTREGGGAVYKNGTHSGICYWMSGARFRRVEFKLTKTWSTPNTKIKVYAFRGPSGGTKLLRNIALSGTARTFQVNINIDGNFDALRIDIDCDSSTSITVKTGPERVVISQMKIFDIADDDGWVSGGDVKGVVHDLVMNRMGMITNNILNPPTVGEILPIYWDRSSEIAEMMDGLCEYEAPRYWGIYERDFADPQRRYKVGFALWGAGIARSWKVPLSHVIDRPEAEDDVYNQARVFYTTLSGRKKSVVVKPPVDPVTGNPIDPLVGTARALATGVPREFAYEIPEDFRRRNDNLPRKVGAAILEDHKESKWSGTINVNTLWDEEGVPHSSLLARHGDTITITEWPGGGGKRFLVNEANHKEAEDSDISLGAKDQTWESFFKFTRRAMKPNA